MKKILVTGANGLLGANLLRMLCTGGYEVTAFLRRSARLDFLWDMDFNILHGRIDSAEDVDKAVKGQDYVIHTAAITTQFGISQEQYEKINIDGTRYVAEACLRHGVKRLIYVSTANSIGPGSIKDPGTELNNFSLFKARSGYINSKYLAHQLILDQVVRNHLPAVIIHPTFMIGPYDRKPGSGEIILYGLRRKCLFYPTGGKNFVAVRDVCTGILHALEKGKIGDSYLLAGENLSYHRFFGMVNNISGRTPLMIRIPSIFLKMLGAAGSAWQMLTRKPVRLNRSTAYLLCLENYYSGSKAEKDLGVTYQAIPDAVREAYNWFVANDMLP